MGDVGHRVFEGLIPLPVPAALLAQQAELAVEAGGQTAHGPVLAGDGEEGVGVRLQALLEPPADLLRRAAHEQDLPRQQRGDSRQKGAQGQEEIRHGETPSVHFNSAFAKIRQAAPYFTSFLRNRIQPREDIPVIHSRLQTTALMGFHTSQAESCAACP